MLLAELVEALRDRLLASGVEVAAVVPLWQHGAGTRCWWGWTTRCP